MTSRYRFEDALARLATGSQKEAEVLQLEPPNQESVMARASVWAGLSLPDFIKCRLNELPTASSSTMASYRFSNGGVLSVYPQSGAAEASLTEAWRDGPIAPDEQKADRKGLRPYIDRMANTLAATELLPDEELRNESFWEIRGDSVTLKGVRGPTALLSVVGAYRRYVRGLPVLGRASVHVKFGAGNRLTGWGVHWRRRTGKAVASAKLVEADEAARRISTELSRVRLERPVDLDEIRVESFQLGYLSGGRLSPQRLFQPAWVAVLGPRPGTSMGKVVVVPASTAPIGSVVETARA